ncbi:MAG TPA: lysophospholipid acyltransferase family protein [Streptosporangiaceae bacterium]|nr:lysophospholipid acyltransferase family protein [Streptosporangiaceae bacterium]
MTGQTPRRRADGSYSTAWRNFSKIILRPGIRMMMKLDWAGQQHIPAQGATILAVNHLSYMDIFAVSLFADSARRYPVFLAKSSLFDIPVLGAVLARLGQLPVFRGQADAALVLREAEMVARSGACVIFYPEATVTRDPDLWPMVSKTGVARLALETGAPVVPVAHWGAQKVLPYGRVFPRLLPRKTVQIIAGPPVDLSAFAGQKPTPQVLRAMTQQIMSDVTVLVGQLRGETPPPEPFRPAAAGRQPLSEPRPPAQEGGGAPAQSTPLTPPADPAAPPAPAR